MADSKSYRKQFSDPDQASTYDKIYSEKTGDQLLWQVEKRFLEDIVNKLRKEKDEIEYLDFACGTGRVVSYVESKVDRATGIEISPEMVKIADTYCEKAELLCKDITAEDADIENSYDMITTFRFILNAEPDLRKLAFRALVARLKDDSSILVFNNHANFWSYKLLLWPIHAVIRRLPGVNRREGNYMTHRQVVDLVNEVGVEIVEHVGMGFISPKFLKILPYNFCLKIEQFLAGNKLIQALGVNQLYVCRIAKKS